MPISAHEYRYVEWQNRATEFYISARMLYASEHYRAAAYSAAITIELILKATLCYWVKGFSPEAASHGLAKLARMVRNKVPESTSLVVPEYFYFEQRYLSLSRYPKKGKGLAIPASMIEDLDTLFCAAIQLVPFQHNTQLKSALRGRKPATLTALRRRNKKVRALRKFLAVPAP
jgi:HEPN domain-containing protein